MAPRVSVVIPLYNKEPYIARAVQSVLSQKFQNFELIVVDDGSTDNGAEIVKKNTDFRIKLIQQKNGGVSSARNRGVSEATSDFIAFLDADDEWTSTHLETLIHLRENYPLAGAYTTAYQIQEGNGKIRMANYQAIPAPPWNGLLPNYFTSIALGDHPVCCSVIGIPQKIIAEFNGFPENVWWGEDAYLFGRIALKYPIAFSSEVGAIYHWAPSDRACNRGLPLDDKEHVIKMLREALDKGEVPARFIESVNEYISRKEIFRASQNILTGKSDNAEEILKECKTKWHRVQKLKWVIMAKIPPRIIRITLNGMRKVIEHVRKF